MENKEYNEIEVYTAEAYPVSDTGQFFMYGDEASEEIQYTKAQVLRGSYPVLFDDEWRYGKVIDQGSFYFIPE